MKEDRNLIPMIALLVLLVWGTETLLSPTANPLYQFGAILVLLAIGFFGWVSAVPETKEKQDVPP